MSVSAYWLTTIATIVIAGSAIATLFSTWTFRRWIRNQRRPRPMFISGVVRRKTDPHGFEIQLEIGNLGELPLFIRLVSTWFWVGKEWVPNDWETYRIDEGMIRPYDARSITVETILYGDTLQWYKERLRNQGTPPAPERDDVQVTIYYVSEQEEISERLENLKIWWDHDKDEGQIVPPWIWKEWPGLSDSSVPHTFGCDSGARE